MMHPGLLRPLLVGFFMDSGRDGEVHEQGFFVVSILYEFCACSQRLQLMYSIFYHYFFIKQMSKAIITVTITAKADTIAKQKPTALTK
jgi:hypothetical protein